MKLSEHFTLEEMVFSQTAVRFGYKNQPNKRQTAALTNLCATVLEPLRSTLGKPIHVSSGYRAPAVNRAVGGSTNSQHMRGEAADIQVTGMSTQELFDFVLASGIPFDQIIQEFDSWVHISYKPSGPQRFSVLYAKIVKGKVKYTRKVTTDIAPSESIDGV